MPPPFHSFVEVVALAVTDEVFCKFRRCYDCCNRWFHIVCFLPSAFDFTQRGRYLTGLGTGSQHERSHYRTYALTLNLYIPDQLIFLFMRPTKYCPRCGATHDVALFCKKGRHHFGWCRECSKASSREQVASGYFQGLARNSSAKRAEVRLTKAAAVEARGPKPLKSVPFILTDIERVASDMRWNIKKRSIRNGLELGLDRESPNSMVHEFCQLNHFSLSGKDPCKPSPDRIDNSKGYTKDCLDDGELCPVHVLRRASHRILQT